MTLYNIFDTQAEAEQAQDHDFQRDKARAYLTGDKVQLDAYYAITIRLHDVRQRMDGKWCYPTIPTSGSIYRTEEKTSIWFIEEQPEEEQAK